MASSSCFNSIFADLNILKNTPRFEYYSMLLIHKIMYLRTFHLCARKWGNHYDGDIALILEAHLVNIEDTIFEIAEKIHPFCHHSAHLFHERYRGLVKDSASRIHSFKKEINRWYIKFSDCSSQSSSSCSHDKSDELLEIIESVLSTLEFHSWQKYTIEEALVYLLETLEERLKFLRDFIRFTTMRGGIDDKHLGPLLTHINPLVVSAAHYTYMCEFNKNDEDKDEIKELRLKISQLLQKIKPVDPHVYETCILALNRSKLSRQSHTSTLEKDVHILSMQDFITSLLSYLFEILKDGAIPQFSTDYQLHILNGRLRSLRSILKKLSDNFNEKMWDLIGVVVCDAGLVIFSLFQGASEDGLAKEMDHLLSDLLERIKLIRAEVARKSPQAGSSVFNIPKVDELSFIAFLLEDLVELTSPEEAASTAIAKHQIQAICEELLFFRSFLEKIVELRDEKKELRALWNRVVELAHSVELLTDSLVIGDTPGDSSSPVSFDSITQEFNIIKLDALKISEKEGLDVKFVMKKITKRFNDSLPLERSMPMIEGDVIPLHDEETPIKDRLTKVVGRLQIVAITGMPGLGKTTLAKLIYNDSSIISHFCILSWCCISQVYEKKTLLLEILACILCKLPDECSKKSEDDLALELYQRLKRKRFLIVLDDVWNVDVWNSLKESFPDDKNGSKILLTTRLRDVANKLDAKPHFLRQLTDDESWKLLKAKLYPRVDWPLTLHELGTQIVKRCKGLPLTITIVAGILATMEHNNWKEVVEGLSSSTVSVMEQCKNTLELSYKFLPDKLKRCLLYFGAFPEDEQLIPAKLTWLWIAEGFVCKMQAKSLEDEAKDYLMHLIDRSLITVDKRSSTGGVKTCRIHDLLHEFCVEKGKEENFFRILRGYDELFDFDEPYNVRRLCIHSKTQHFKESRLFCPRARCLLFFNCDNRRLEEPYFFPLSHIGMSKLARVLDLSQIALGRDFPGEIELLVQLRFLAVRGQFRFIPSSISKLSKLETLIVDASSFRLPYDFWNLKKLRHLHISYYGFHFSHGPCYESAELCNLDTLSTVVLHCDDLEKQLRKFPNIRKLKCKMFGFGDSTRKSDEVLVFNCLSRLKSLKVSPCAEWFEKHQIEFCFPLNLRKLTLSKFGLPWCKISAIGNLPNLEVLKLLDGAFMGEIWNMEESEQFPRLRFLKLCGLDIGRWTASKYIQDDPFPRLVKLVLEKCRGLKEVPSCLGDIPDLRMIEVSNCSGSAVNSIKQIAEEQVSMGNDDLKVVIHSSKFVVP